MIALIDADSIIFHSLPKKANPDQTYEECVQEMHNRIDEIINIVGATDYALFLTGKNCFRYKNYKYSNNYKYKRGNGSLPPIFYALKEHMLQNYNTVLNHDLEADDLVSFYYTQFKQNKQQVIICSPDKDVLFQNVGMHYDYKKKTFIEVKENDVEFFLFKQVGCGDATDNISGIEGVGDKTIDKWFKEVGKNHTYQAILIDKYIDKYGIHEGINRFFETFSMVYILKTEDDMLREIGYVPEHLNLSKWKEEEITNLNDLI